MADAERVVLAFGARRKRREPALLLDGVQLLAPAGQHLVRIGLVAHVPDEPVMGCVKDVVQRDSQLDGAQSSGEVTAAGADALDQKFPQLLGQRRSLAGDSLRRSAGLSMVSSNGYLGRSFGELYTGQDWPRNLVAGSSYLMRLTRTEPDRPKAPSAAPSGASAAMARSRSSRARSRAACRPAVLGYVGLLCAASAPVDLPSTAHRLRRRECHPESERRDRCRRRKRSRAPRNAGPPEPGAEAPSSTLPWMSAPVLRRCMFSTAPRSASGRPQRDRRPARPPCRSCRRRAPGCGSSQAGLPAPACRSYRRQDRESERLQRIADENGGRFIIGAMAGGAAAAQIIIVHRRQIIVHEAVDVNELDRRGGRIEVGSGAPSDSPVRYTRAAAGVCPRPRCCSASLRAAARFRVGQRKASSSTGSIRAR